MTDEELSNLLENSNKYFGYSSLSDLGEGDSSDKHCNFVFNANFCSQNNTVDNDVVCRMQPAESRSTNYTWANDPPQINKILFSKTAYLKTWSLNNKPIDYFSMLLTDEFIEFIVQETNL